MLKTLLMLLVALSLSLTASFAAAVEVNTADQAALESVKGLGPVKSKAIIDERTKNGPFKSADDLANRVKGLGQKSVANLEAAGLTIGGSTAPPTGAQAAPAAGSRGPRTQAA
ncbi:ComEA family DNA-binding protein, partial [Burkholderia glumae]